MHQLLENMIESLKCYKCQAIPGPNRDKRYSCHKNSHQLCEKCRSKCKCGSSVMKCANLIVEKLLQDLPIYCQNYKRKCPQIFDEVKDLEEHEKKCEFKILYCQNNRRKCPQIFDEVKDLEEHEKMCEFKILFCQNYSRKCFQTFYDPEKQEDHEKTCDFRVIICPSKSCRINNNGAYVEMPFISWDKHCLTKRHKQEYQSNIDFIVPKQPKTFSLKLPYYMSKIDQTKAVQKYLTFFQFFKLPNNLEFCLIGEVVDITVQQQQQQHVHIWICINGSPSEAKRYNYDIYYEGYYKDWQIDKVDMGQIRFQVKTLEENPLDIIREKSAKIVELDDVKKMMANKIDFVITIFDLEKPKKTWAQKLFGN